jgi:hypothetical protein
MRYGRGQSSLGRPRPGGGGHAGYTLPLTRQPLQGAAEMTEERGLGEGPRGMTERGVEGFHLSRILCAISCYL